MYLRSPAAFGIAFSSALLLAACAGPNPMHHAMSSQADVPAAVRVPTGHRVALSTVGVGEITYECRKAADAGAAAAWVFAGPAAALNDRGGKQVGNYYGPPATWEAADGSKITGTQVAVAPGGTGNIPFQLVKANPAMGQGAMTGVSYVQRVATRGGVAPALPCGTEQIGSKQVVKYQADYLFWMPA